ncbi:MAG: putative hydrolase [Friedmanniella sp.]|nr:putative hydrolase [Friedmanniella sp.]
MTSTSTPTTRTVTSTDGTTLAYEVRGRGPALVLVDGALCQRAMGPSRGLTAELGDRFTVYAYDRRDRGDSGTGRSPWSADREVEDLAAVLEAAGPGAHLFGASSGAVLALEAARRGLVEGRVVAYEAPFIVDGSHAPNDPQLPEKVRALVEGGRRGEAVKTFLRVVGAPAPMVALMPLMPPWKRMTAVAHTLAYDLSLVVGRQQGQPLPAGAYAGVTAPTLVIAGGKSPAYMRNAQAAIAAAVPGARLLTLAGQTHMIKPKALAPVVAEFLLS